MEKGLRIIPTFRCSQKCKFCYQAHLRESGPVLLVRRLKEILDEIDLEKYDYATFMGGEVTEIPNFVDYVKAVKERFAGRINLTTNGTADVDAYLSLADSGVEHITFSSIAPCLRDKIKALKDRVNLRINVFLPDVDWPPTDEQEADMRKVCEAFIKAKTFGTQLNILYDYATEIDDYEAATTKIEKMLHWWVSSTLETVHVDKNFMIMRDCDFEAWVDINYQKGQELVITPEGELARGFDYMEKYGGTFQAQADN